MRYMQSVLIDLAVGVTASLIASLIVYGIKKFFARKKQPPFDQE